MGETKGNRAGIAMACVSPAILAGAVVLRCVGIGHREFWHDEYCSLLYATAPEGTLQALRVGGNPPLYFLILRSWMGLFGTGEVPVRALSAVFSTASIGALGLWLRSLALPRRSILWSMTLASITPLHLFYAREARGYALLLLILALALWSYTEALRRGSRAWWALHGVFCLLGFYTHNLLVPLIVAFWLSAAIRRAGRRAWCGMLAAHGAALALYVPWMSVAAGQAASGQTRWIVKFWQSYPPLLAIPRSLLAFGVGGPIPIYIAWPSPAQPIVWLSGAFFAAMLLIALTLRGGVTRSGDGPGPGDERSGSARGDLLVFLVAPLLGLWIASVLAQPIYVVGRYDLIALPAFLGLAGVGIGELQRGLSRSTGAAAAVAVPAAILAVLAMGAILPRFRADAAPDSRPNTRRADLLASVVGPEDLIVSHDLAASNVLFLTRQRRIAAKVVTFPAEILGHWGWFNADESMGRGTGALTEEAVAILEAHRDAHPRGRVWLLPHLKSLSALGRPHEGNPHQQLFDILLAACRREGMVLSYPAGADPNEYLRVGLVPLSFTGRGNGSSPDPPRTSASERDHDARRDPRDHHRLTQRFGRPRSAAGSPASAA